MSNTSHDGLKRNPKFVHVPKPESEERRRFIWKYPLAIADQQEITIHEGARILSVQMQDGKLCLWAMIRPDRPEERMVINVIGTGHPIDIGEDEDLQHLGTVQQGALVWHVFARLSWSDELKAREAK